VVRILYVLIYFCWENYCNEHFEVPMSINLLSGRNRFLHTRPSIAIAHISYGNSVCPSVCSGVTAWYRLEPTWDRDFWFSSYDSLGSLVFSDKISCHWVKGVPTNEGAKEGHPLKRCYFTAIARLAWKWLQIGTDMLLIITSTDDMFLWYQNQWPWTPKLGVLVIFGDFWLQKVS